MTCKEKIIIDIEDNTRQYYLDEVTCFEKPFVVLLNDYKNKYGQYFLLLCKILRVYMYGNNDVSDDVKQCLRLFIRDILGLTPIERQEELDIISALIQENCILDTIGENNRKEEFDNTNEYLIKMNLEADCLKVQFISDASTKELKMMIERLAPVEVGLMVKTWGNGGFLEVDFKESQAIISNK